MSKHYLGRFPKHRGTWSTLAMILLLAVGVCTVVFGVFSLPDSLLRGISLALLGAGMTAPSLWWLRWYQFPFLLKYALGAAVALIVLGAAGILLGPREEDVSEEEMPVIPTPATSTVTSTLPTASAQSSTSDATSSGPEPSDSRPTETEPTVEAPTETTSIVTEATTTAGDPVPYSPPAPAPPPPAALPLEPAVPQPPLDDPEVSAEFTSPVDPPVEESPVEDPHAPENPFGDLLPTLTF